MSRWNDDESSASSSDDGSIFDSGGGNVSNMVNKNDDGMSRNRRKVSHLSAGSAATGTATTSQRRRNSRTEDRNGIPSRWIMDRVEGQVYDDTGALASRPPCFWCWPPPMVHTCPGLLENNRCCTTLGQCGFCSGSVAQSSQRRDYYSGFDNRGRCAVMSYALILNIAGLLATIFATLALTDNNITLLKIASFSTTSLQPKVFDTALQGILDDRQTTFPETTLRLGLQAILIRDDVTVAFEDFCTTPGMEQLLPLDDCNKCHDATLYMIVGLLLATVTYVPNFAVNCLRMYRDYDMNCQKGMGLLWSSITLVCYGVTYYHYRYQCLASFYEGPLFYGVNGTVEGPGMNGDGGAVLINFDWTMGTGQICLIVGLTLKAIDFLSHGCLSTPTITRSLEEQWRYERVSKEAEVGRFPIMENGSDDNK